MLTAANTSMGFSLPTRSWWSGNEITVWQDEELFFIFIYYLHWTNLRAKLNVLVAGNLMSGYLVLLPKAFNRICKSRGFAEYVSVPSFDLDSDLFPCQFSPSSTSLSASTDKSVWAECWAFCLSSGTFPLQFLYKSKVPVEVTSAKWLMGWTGLKDSKNRYCLLEVICKSRSRCLVVGLCAKHFNLSKQHYKGFLLSPTSV